MKRKLLIAIAGRYEAHLRACARYAPYAAALALAAVVAVQIGRLALVLVPILAKDEAAAPRVTSSSSAAPPATGLESLAAAHLFGEISSTHSAPPLPEPAADAPPTSLELTLTGNLLAEHDDSSWAIIADSAVERSYRAGDTLASGDARLHAVYADYVILERADSRLEALRQSEWQALGGASPAPLVADAAPEPEATPFSPPATSVTPAATNVAAASLRAPGESPVASVIRFTAYNDGGIVGLRASPGPDSQTFRELGLKAGDVITGVNGTGLGNAPNGTALVRALQTSPLVNVSLIRNGIPQVVTVPAAVFGERLARR